MIAYALDHVLNVPAATTEARAFCAALLMSMTLETFEGLVAGLSSEHDLFSGARHSSLAVCHRSSPLAHIALANLMLQVAEAAAAADAERGVLLTPTAWAAVHPIGLLLRVRALLDAAEDRRAA